MHSFEVHSNESACRKKVRLGLEQVYDHRSLKLPTVICLVKLVYDTMEIYSSIIDLRIFLSSSQQ